MRACRCYTVHGAFVSVGEMEAPIEEMEGAFIRFGGASLQVYVFVGVFG